MQTVNQKLSVSLFANCGVYKTNPIGVARKQFTKFNNASQRVSKKELIGIIQSDRKSILQVVQKET